MYSTTVRVYIFATILISTIVLPFIRLPQGIPDVRLEFLVLITVWVLVLGTHLATGRPIRWRRLPVNKWFVIIGLCVFISTVHAAWVMGAPIAMADFWEFAKVGLYFLMFAFGSQLRVHPGLQDRIYVLAISTLVVSASIGFLQYINFGGINQTITPYYAPTQIRGVVVQGRIVGTTSNPNEFGGLMVLALSMALSGGLSLAQRRLRVLAWITVPIFLTALGLTLSRTALASLVIAWTTIVGSYMLEHRKIREQRRLILAWILGLSLIVILVQMLPTKAISRFEDLKAFNEATSWQARIDKYWIVNYALWLESPVFGWGPAKALIGRTVDNEWLLFARRYGLVGLSAFVGFFGSLYVGLMRARRRATHPTSIALTLAMQGTVAGYAVFMVPAVVYHSLQLMPILLVFVGLAFAAASSEPKRL